MSLYVLCLECKKQIPAALRCRGTRDVASTCAQLPVLPGLGSSADWLGLQHKSRRGQQGSLPAQRGSSSPTPLPQVIDPVLTLSLPTPPTPASGTSLAGRGASATHVHTKLGRRIAHMLCARRAVKRTALDANMLIVISCLLTSTKIHLLWHPMDEAWAKQYMQAVQKRERIQTEADQKRVEAQRAQHQIHICYFDQVHCLFSPLNAPGNKFFNRMARSQIIIESRVS
ncbi:hypothetical protein K438DRAFT_1860391 [Mycena galopus ATCC 62051]|nr:hypothetical protein K438DRAFT_1860391 [Mycena galopus ATCC 62051]